MFESLWALANQGRGTELPVPRDRSPLGMPAGPPSGRFCGRAAGSPRAGSLGASVSEGTPGTAEGLGRPAGSGVVPADGNVVLGDPTLEPPPDDWANTAMGKLTIATANSERATRRRQFPGTVCLLRVEHYKQLGPKPCSSCEAGEAGEAPEPPTPRLAGASFIMFLLFDSSARGHVSSAEQLRRHLAIDAEHGDELGRLLCRNRARALREQPEVRGVDLIWVKPLDTVKVLAGPASWVPSSLMGQRWYQAA